jgi:hypothetical protein
MTNCIRCGNPTGLYRLCSNCRAADRVEAAIARRPGTHRCEAITKTGRRCRLTTSPSINPTFCPNHRPEGKIPPKEKRLY